ncbi:hypothetical protein DM334_14600 [Salmonella enterica subsp. enterica serovar Newport]|nr:hypothetical protein [Salmonella enterica subsp. enterica serovar Newport]EBV5495387.1 hypothetical protein [Salmonella enterica subsp. enterica serovar Newport]ECD4560087.1 hypothetical protein [Salmonella enterica subsp. enterica serovar Newport]ECM1815482.1 transposase family protein [Salmonella enterica subsp. enterica serovar Newport]
MDSIGVSAGIAIIDYPRTDPDIRGYGCLSSRTKNSPGKPGRFTELLQRAVWNEKCSSSNLMFHHDNGSPMRSYTLQAKMYALGVLSSYSRPRVSNDNPYSESLFRTLKYCPWWPENGFHTIDDARAWVSRFEN